MAGPGVTIAAGSGFDDSTKIFSSKRPSVPLPDEPELGFVEYLFSKTAAQKDKLALIEAWDYDVVLNANLRAYAKGQINEPLHLTYGELETRVRGMAAGMAGKGVQRGSLVLIMLPNCIDFSVSLLASLLLGAVVTTAKPEDTDTVNPMFYADLQRHLSAWNTDFSDSFVVTSYQTYRKQEIAFDELDIIPLLAAAPQMIADPERYEGAIFDSMIRRLSISEPLEHQTVLQDDTALLLFPSGMVTESSKGVVLTHRNLIGMATTFCADCRLNYEEVSEDDVCFCLTPQFHVYGIMVTIAHLLKGSTVLTMQKKFAIRENLGHFKELEIFAYLEKYRVTDLFVLPAMLLEFSRERAETLRKYDLHRLTRINCFSPVAKEILQRCALLYPGVKLLQGCGFVETTGMGASFPANGPNYKPEYFGSVGLLAANTEARVVGGRGNLKVFLPPLRQGELWLRGPGIMNGYVHDPKATAEVLDNERWFHTGFSAYFNLEGYLFVVSKISDLINYKGFQVAPGEVERFLLMHPQVKDAAVIAYPDPVSGYTIPMACIVRWTLELQPTKDEIQYYIAEKVQPFMKVRDVQFVESIPRLPSGEIQRDVLLHQIQLCRAENKSNL